MALVDVLVRTKLLLDSVDAYVLAMPSPVNKQRRQLGHADIALTVGTYGAWLKPERRHTLDALDRLPAEPADVPAATKAQTA